MQYERSILRRSLWIYVNVFMAIFTADKAGLRLYNMLNRLAKNIVYYDTESMIMLMVGRIWHRMVAFQENENKLETDD